MLLEVLPPLDWDKEKKHESWEAVFKPVRQPDWWKGDAEYHGPAYEEPFSELERRLKSE